MQIAGAPTVDRSSFIPMDVFNQLERPSNQPRAPVQAGVDQTSYISQPDRFAVFDQIHPNRRPLNEVAGVDETPLISMEKIRLLEIPSKASYRPDEADEKAEAPIVLAPLQPIDTQEGTPIVLTAKITGAPVPNVRTSHQTSIIRLFLLYSSSLGLKMIHHWLLHLVSQRIMTSHRN